MMVSPTTKKSILNVWTILTIITLPIAAYFILYTEINNFLILAIQIPVLIGILISQKLYYRHQFAICSNCFLQREFHNRQKYPDLSIACNNFEKGKDYK